ncbi:MAG TPA: hypothetical protein VLX85_07900 [Stellaceae bacterium]|nr:hypothetical protein [Stellaceae bacterium]
MRSRARGEATAGRSRRFAGWLSIAAVLLQLVVSAWHIHPEDYAFLAGAAVDGGDHVSPSTRQPGAPGHEDCALCVTLQLAVGAALPDSGGVTPPSATETLPPAMPDALHLASTPYLLFRTRAPPTAA